jgi:hypothetical protein
MVDWDNITGLEGGPGSRRLMVFCTRKKRVSISNNRLKSVIQSGVRIKKTEKKRNIISRGYNGKAIK